MATLLAVGNDVVDLGDPRCAGRAADQRFLARVFSPEERRAIADAPDPDLALWLRWAAKEAAFKVVSKVRGSPPPFRHAAFVAALDRPGSRGSDAASLSGTVRYGAREVALRARVETELLHVLAVPAGEGFDEVEAGVAPLAGEGTSLPDPGEDPPAWSSFLERRFSPAERASIHSAPSALVRLRARETLCRRLGRDEGDVEIVCHGGPAGRTPPEVLVGGSPGRGDVSLSHHGRWVGWAVRTAED